jgi:N-methylhydantoinase A
MGLIAGVDVGGTFTDICIVDEGTGNVVVGKVPTTENQAEGFVAGLRMLADIGDVRFIAHGTTVGTNALLERKGARTGVIASEGFSDLIELGRRTRPTPYGMKGIFEPLISRDQRMDVPERILASGEVLTPLDHEAVRSAVQTLLAKKVESIAVIFMHSYANPDNERRCREIIEEIGAKLFISLSHEVLPEIGEFERSSTTVINAYLQPLLTRYLERVDDELKNSGYRNPFRVMQSNGGVLNAANAARNACRSVLSGPAGGMMAANWISTTLGRDIISADMGGTSFDVGLVMSGDPVLAEQKEIDYGIPSRIPMIDIETIGAGGGSIIRVDAGGLLKVGPESAGSIPGPICYDRGGEEPTVTDANALLGRIEIERIASGAKAGVEPVRTAFDAIGAQLGLDAEGAAQAALEVADLLMANAIRRVSLNRGLDPRKFSLLPFGGAGPVHACSIADILEIPTVIVPPWPGVFSAVGCILAGVRYDDTWSVLKRIDQISTNEITELFDRMESRIFEVLDQEGVERDSVRFTYEAALQYEGQTHRVNVPLENARIQPEEIARKFEQSYQKTFSVEISGLPVRLVNLRLRAMVESKGMSDLQVAIPDSGSIDDAIVGQGRMRFAGEWHETPVLDRWSIARNVIVDGPARIIQSDTTIIIPPGWRASVDRMGNLELTREAAANA